jgi:hypothetical protein
MTSAPFDEEGDLAERLIGPFNVVGRREGVSRMQEESLARFVFDPRTNWTSTRTHLKTSPNERGGVISLADLNMRGRMLYISPEFFDENGELKESPPLEPLVLPTPMDINVWAKELESWKEKNLGPVIVIDSFVGDYSDPTKEIPPVTTVLHVTPDGKTTTGAYRYALGEVGILDLEYMTDYPDLHSITSLRVFDKPVKSDIPKRHHEHLIEPQSSRRTRRHRRSK